MTTIRVAKRAKYTVIDRRTLNDERLSYRARGVLAWLLDKPDDWVTDADTVAAGGREGRDAIRSALCELEEFGYLVRHRERDHLGKWRRDWIVYENPPQRVSSDGPRRISSDGSHQPKRRKSAGHIQDGKPATGNQRRETRPEKEVLRPSTELSTETITEGSQSKSRATSVPSAFEVTPEMKKWAAKTGVTVDLSRETDQWADYHRAKGTLAKDWVASWRTWMRNSIKFERGRTRSGPDLDDVGALTDPSLWPS